MGPPCLQELSSPLCHRHSWLFITLLAMLFAHTCFALEVIVGKNPQLTARNGTDVYLPCIFTACIGFEDVTFRWEYRFNETAKPEELQKGTLKNKKSVPKIIDIKDKSYRQARVTLVPSNETKDYNLTLRLSEVDFDDAGRYTCIVTNKKEKSATSNATIFLSVVDKFVVVDNTLTLIIASVVGGVIGLLILILIIKKTVCFILKRKHDKKKDCLVSSSVNDNTDIASKPEKPKA